MIEQNPAWLIPFGLLMLVMLHAMMEFTVSLLYRAPLEKREPIPAAELRKRLLTLNQSDPPIGLAQGVDCDLEIRLERRDPPPTRLRGFAGGGSSSLLRLLFDEPRHEVRLNEVSRSYGYLLGISGWLPRLGGGYSFQAGPPGEGVLQQVSQVVQPAGWGVRPVIWPFQATYSVYRTLTRLTPAPLRRWPARRFWGIVYPLSYALGMLYLLAILGPLTWYNLFWMVGISLAWWGVWGFLTWVLLGFPAFWRGGKD